MNAPGQSTIVLVCGRKGAGKSKLIKRGLRRLRRFVAWDVRGEYCASQHGIAGARLWTDLRAWRAHLLAGGTIEREVFSCPSAQFKAWCAWVFATGRLTVVIEELGRHCSNGRASPELLDLIERSRHAHIDLIATTARLERVPKDIRAQVDELLVPSMSEPNDVAYLQSWLGESVVARVRFLQPNRFLRIRP